MPGRLGRTMEAPNQDNTPAPSSHQDQIQTGPGPVPTGQQEFSLMRTLAGVAQAMALVCLAGALWKLLTTDSGPEPVKLILGFSGVLQLTALTFYIMDHV